MKFNKVTYKAPRSLEEVLRLVRLSVETNVEIHSEVENRIKKRRYKNDFSNRSRLEFEKILLSDYVDIIFHKLKNLNILKDFLPELDECYNFNQKTKYHNRDVFNHIMSVTSLVPKTRTLRYAALFHDIGKPKCFNIDINGVGHFKNHDRLSSEIANNILTKWNLDEELVEEVTNLISKHMRKHNDGSIGCLKKLKKEVGKENINNLLILQIADNLSKNLRYVSIKGLISLYNINNKKAVSEA
ncbi:MAG: HD domain-containing protein [Clostridium sp.]